MPNRLSVIIVASLFILLSNSSIAQSTSESTDSTLPDFILEPAWDEDIPWSIYLGPNDGENRIAFNVTNIGGDLPEDCLENCSIRYWVDNGTDHQHHWVYHFGSHINTTDSGKEKLRNLFEGNTTRWEVPNAWYGDHTVTACIDAGNDVEESNEDNNCWEGTFNFLPDLRWHQGNPEGTFESWLDSWIYDNGGKDPIEAENDFFIQSGKLRIVSAYQCAVNSTYGNCSYGGNFIQMSVTVDGEEIDWWNHSSWGANIEAGESTLTDATFIETSSVVCVCFDPNNLIEESNEDNNCLEKTLVNETEEADEDSDEERGLPAPSFIATIGVLALAAVASRNINRDKN